MLLDMDGTLLDLNYDNHLWNRVLPERVARRTYGNEAPDSTQIAATAQALLAQMRTVQGTIEFYSLRYWAAHTGLDIIALHEELAHLVRYRPSAERFLERLGQLGINRVLATNAHRASLSVKHDHCGINDKVDAVVSSHDYGHPKESQGFWQALQQQVDFEPARTLFIDDNDAVLNSARAFGIGHLRTVAQPDMDQPPRSQLNYPAFNDFAEIMPAALA